MLLVKSIFRPLWFCVFLFVISCQSNSEHFDKTNNESNDSSNIDGNNSGKRPLSLCLSRLPEVKLNYLKNRFYFDETIQNSQLESYKRGYAVILDSGRWRKNHLNIFFITGIRSKEDSIVRKRIETTAKKWERYANVFLDFSARSNDTDISISFMPADGTWSQVGQYSKGIVPSMNFDDLRWNDDDYFYDYYVLHEFGHALGLEHEHQSPNSNVVWNMAALLNYCARYNPPWDEQRVREQIVNRFSLELVRATRYDPESIMMYSFPDSLIISGNIPQEANIRVSKIDSSTIHGMFRRFRPVRN